MITNELSIASSELAIEWNDNDPSQVLLTAFHQDWTYDVFQYNGQEGHFGRINIEDPFPKWFGTNTIVTGHIPEHPLDGGNLIAYNPITEESNTLNMSGIVFFDTFGDSLLIVQSKDDNEMLYSITDKSGVVQYEWSMPAVSNYSEWIFPQISWTSNHTVFLSSTGKGGQLDELTIRTSSFK